MATAKKTPAAKPSTSRALAPWMEEMAKAATKQAAAERTGGNFAAIHLRGGILTIDDKKVPGNELDTVVLAAVSENQFYTGGFDPSNPSTPSCYAFSEPGQDAKEAEATMAPHPSAPHPVSETCKSCPNNVMGSGTDQNGNPSKGKACKNVKRLLLTTADVVDDVSKIEAAEVRALKISVMNVKHWANYVHMVADDTQRPVYGVVTKIGVEPDLKSQFKINFSLDSLVEFTGETYQAIVKKVAQAEKDIVLPYPVMEAQPAAAPKQRMAVPTGAAAKKAPAKTAAAGVKKGKY
jgi:hypothetical protein